MSTTLIEHAPANCGTVPLRDCLIEVTQGVGKGWSRYPVLGATRAGLAPAKEPVGKSPHRYKLVEPGTIFYNPMRILLGSIAMVDDGDPSGITSPDYVVVRTRKGVLHHRYFYYWLRSTWGEQLILQLARGGVRERMLFNRLVEGEIVLPTWSIQERIAKALATVPTIRGVAEIRLSAAQGLPGAYLRELFDGPEASSWPLIPLAEVCIVQSGQVDPRDADYSELPHINGENIESGTGRLLKVNTAREDGLISGKYLFEPGMILYSKLRPYLKKVTIAPYRGVCSADMYPLSFDASRVNPRFALWSLLADRFTTYAVGESQRARMPKLNREQLFAWEMPTPPLDRQCEVVAALEKRLNAASRLVFALTEELAAIDAMPAVLLGQAFEGGHCGS